MLKTFIRVTITNQFNNATVCLRQFYHQKVEMQNQNYNNNNSSSYLKSPATRDNNSEQDVLSNVRKWKTVESPNTNFGFIFTLLNYNLLSQKLLESHSYLYEANSRAALQWSNRLYNIAGEIFKTNASILCCQVSARAIV
jgi:mRNA deadenylase 3'-5' endonuclease subunit Ccr4